MNLIDLKAKFGRQYRIQLDPAFPKQSQDPAAWVIPCKSGEIFAHDDSLLAAEVNGPKLAKRASEIPGVTVHQAGDGYVCVLFPVELFDAIAEIVKPRKKRQLSPSQKAASAERLSRWQFKQT